MKQRRVIRAHSIEKSTTITGEERREAKLRSGRKDGGMMLQKHTSKLGLFSRNCPVKNPVQENSLIDISYRERGGRGRKEELEKSSRLRRRSKRGKEKRSR